MGFDRRNLEPLLESRHLEQVAPLTEFCDRHIAKEATANDDAHARELARWHLRQMGTAGWLNAIADRDLRACCLIREQLARVSSLADAVFAVQALAITPLLNHGSDAQQRQWLGPLQRGEKIGAFALTETAAGSDIAAMECTARREGSAYRLDGQKSFISNAGIADVYILFAKTAATAKGQEVSAFVVPADTEGLTFARPQLLSAPHPLGELSLKACHLPSSACLGAIGHGMRIALGTLDTLRTTVAAAACGMAQRAIDEAIQHASTREQFGKRLADFQLTQQKIARMSIDLCAARLLTYSAARHKDRGAQRVTLESSMAKAFATEAAQRIIDDAVQILGGRGVVMDHPVDRLYRAVRALRIYEGTTEIQQLLVAREMFARHAAQDRAQTAEPTT